MRRILLLAAVASVVVGCAPGFHLSESEVATYGGHLRTAAGANDVLQPWAGQVVELHFASGIPPRIQSSNLQALFRTMGLFRFPADMMDRLSAQLERQLDDWIGPELMALVSRNDARLEELRRISLTILSPPAFAYQPDRQVVAFTGLRVRMVVSGTVYVREADDRYSLTIFIDGYALDGELQLGAGMGDAARVRLRVSPRPGAVAVSGARQEVRDAVAALVRQAMSVQVDASTELAWDAFALPRVRLYQDPPTGGLWTGLAGSGRFATSRWATWQTTPEMEVLAGDFDGDGKADVMKFDVPTGGISPFGLWVGRSDGTRFTASRWATWDTYRGMKVFTGDFDGDGKTDVATLDVTSATDRRARLVVGRSTGSAFQFSEWAHAGWAVGDDMRLLAGDFDGDGKTDLLIVEVRPGVLGGALRVARSTGSAFTISQWAFWDTYPAMKMLVGDFNGDGKADVMKFDVPDAGTSTLGLWVGLSTGQQFATGQWARWDTNRDIKVVAGDFNGDGQTDVMKFDVPSSGTALLGLWVGLSDGARFDASQWDRWVTYRDMKVLAGDFNGDGRTDVMKFDVVGFPPPRLEVTYLARPEVPEAVVDAAVRGAGGTIYHGRRVGGHWSGFSPVTPMGAIASDVALVAAGPGHLDLAGVTAAGELVHMGWRDGAWRERFGTSSQRPTVTYRPSKPALVATAPGQVEIVAVGRPDGRLYHLRRLNGGWQAARPVPDAPLPQRPLRDPVMVQAGNKLVLLYVDHRHRLFAAAFDMETSLWGQSFELPGRSTVAFTPAVAACGDGRVDVVYVRTHEGSAGHWTLDVQAGNFVPGVGSTGISFVPEGDIGGVLISAPALVCSGYRRLELLGRGTDVRLWHNHFAPTAGARDGRTFNRGWQGWTLASERFIRSGLVGPRRIGAPIALAASRTGQVHLLVAAYGAVSTGGAPPEPQEVLYDAFDGARWGRAPWATVDWRGLEPVPGVTVVGNAALAVSDRAVELAVVGQASRLFHAAATDGGFGRFASLGTSVRYFTEPTVVSAGPGSLEILYLGADDTRRHLRRLNDAVAAAGPMDIAWAVDDFRPAAVAFGAGQIEVVAAAVDRNLYHWRFLRGAWQSPRPVPGAGGPIISVPALVGTGAGQLELFAVGNDQRLYHWRFRGRQWTAARQVSSDFPVSALLFGPASAASGGDGVVDVVVARDGSGQLYHRRIGPDEGMGPGLSPLLGPAGSFAAIGGVTNDVPALTAFSAARLHLLVPRPSGLASTNAGPAPPSSIARDAGPLSSVPVLGPLLRAGQPPALQWSPLEPVAGGRLVLGGVAHVGDSEIIGTAVDRNGRVHLGRFAEGRWGGFWRIGGQRPEMRHFPLLLPALTAH